MIYRQLASRCSVPPPITGGAMDPMLQQAAASVRASLAKINP